MAAPKRLSRKLFAIGFSAGRRTEAGGIRFVSLLAASLALTMALASLVAIGLGSTARYDRARAAVPVLAEDGTPASATLLMQPVFDDLRNDRQFQVFYLDPLGPDAPLPPGLDEWPEPGQVYLSPELASRGTDEGIADRYGDFAGLIDPDALADPGEQLAYVRSVASLDSLDVHPLRVVGFETAGDPEHSWGVHWLAVEHDFSIGGLFAIAAVLLLLPSLLLVVVAVRTGAQVRDRRERLIAVLGGDRRSRFLVSLGESALPVVLGAALAAVAIAAASASEFVVPYVGFMVADGDLRGGWWLLALCPIAAAAGVLLASSLLGMRAGDGRSSRPRAAPRPRLLRLWAALFPVFVLVATVLPQFFAHTPGYPLSNMIGVAGTMVTLPAAVSVATVWVARRAERFGRRNARPAWLVIGRRIAAHPRATARQITGIATGSVFLCLVLAYQGMFTQQTVEAQRELDRSGYAVVEIDPNGDATQEQAEGFASEIGDRAILIGAAVADGPEEASIRFSGECSQLEPLGLPCPEAGTAVTVGDDVTDERLANWLRNYRHGELELSVEVGSPTAPFGTEGATLLAFGLDGGEAPVAELKSAGKAFPLGVNVGTPGEGSLTGGVPLRDQARWVGLFGVTGLALLAGVAAIGAAGEFLRHSRALAPLTAVVGGASVFRGMAALAVWTPLLIAGTIGLGTGVWVTRPLTSMSLNLVTPGLILTCGAVMLAVGAVMWWWASATMIKEASKWRPGNGD